MKRIFVSYSRRNKTFAERIARDLSDAGLDIWIDFRQIHGGELWRDEIFRGIERSEIILLCLSPASIASKWVRREVLTARDQGKFIIPVMLVDTIALLEEHEELSWVLDVQFVDFEGRYEEAFPELLEALPGARAVGVFDQVDVQNIPNPFKGLEAFQQTDSQFFFGRENLISKAFDRLSSSSPTRFLAVVGASGSGKSSLVRAGIIPQIRAGHLPGSDRWPVMIFMPGAQPIEALATRLLPLFGSEELPITTIMDTLQGSPESLNHLADEILADFPLEARLLMVVDQFEEVFTRAGEHEREQFLKLLHTAVTTENGRTLVIITMRADFFGNLSHYPQLAELFEQENMVIATEMTTSNLLRSIEGPAEAVGLIYDDGLVDRILESVRRQPGSLPLLQYALTELYKRREGRRLTMAAYETMGEVQGALAQRAESIYNELNAAQQDMMRRVLLALVEVNDRGEATRRKVNREELIFQGVSGEAVQEIVDLLTAADSRLLIASRQIQTSGDVTSRPVTWLEVSHEALIRRWERFTGWVMENVDQLRYSSQLLQAANDWVAGGRDVAYLLTGTRLARAEAWLESADANPLQRELIRASTEERDRREVARREQQARELALQQQATRRARIIALVMMVSFVIAVGLTVFALQRSDEATQAQQKAERNAAQARSLALSSGASQSFSDDNIDLAIALAVEANQIAEPPPQAQRTLADLAYAPGTRHLFAGHEGSVQGVAFSPNGSVIASASADHTVRLWDRETGDELSSLSHEDSVFGVAFNPDGTLIASAGADHVVRLWDGRTYDPVAILTGHSDSVFSVTFSPDGNLIASAGADNAIRLWNVGTSIELATLVPVGADVSFTSVTFSPDGTKLAAGGDDSKVYLWDVPTYGQSAVLVEHTGAVESVAFSPNGRNLLSGSSDRTLILWDVATGIQRRRFEGHNDAVLSVAFSPDGETILSGAADGTTILWNAALGTLLQEFGSHSGSVESLAFHPDGLSFISASSDATVRLWDINRSEEATRLVGHTGVVWSVDYSFDNRLAASGSQDSRIILWNTTTGAIIRELSGHKGAVTTLALSPDGRQVLSGSQDNSIILWDIESSESVVVLEGHSEPINAVAFGIDGKTAASSAKDGTIILWNLETGTEIRRFGGEAGSDDGGHEKAALSLAISPDGSRLLSGSMDNSIILWNLETGEEIRRFVGHEGAIRALDFSPDGQLALSGSSDKTVRLWNVATGAETTRFVGHTAGVEGAAFSPDGRTVLSGSFDGTLRLWDIASGFEVRRFTVDPGASTGVFDVDFSSDGQTALSGLADSTVRVWRLLPEVADLLAWTKNNRHVRTLETFERKLFGLET